MKGWAKKTGRVLFLLDRRGTYSPVGTCVLLERRGTYSTDCGYGSPAMGVFFFEGGGHILGGSIG